MPVGLPDPEAVLRGHRGEVQALAFDAQERHLVSGDSLGEVRVWDLQDLRPAAIRRLHPLSGGILSLRLFRSAGRQLLGTQGRDGTTLLWACGGPELELSEEPVRSFARDCYSFCRFDVLAAGEPVDDGTPASGGETQHAQQQQEEQQAEEFIAAVLHDSELQQGEAAAAAAAGGMEQQQQQQHDSLEGLGPAAEAVAPQPSTNAGSEGGPPYSTAAVAAAIWAVHPCSQASVAQPPALLAIPGADERTAEVVCAACGHRVCEFREEAAGRKLGMLMAVQLFCAPPAGSTGTGTEESEASANGTPAAAPGGTPAGEGGGSAAALQSPATTRQAGVAAGSPPRQPAAPVPRICLAGGYEDGSVAVWHVGGRPHAPPLVQRQLCSDPVMALAIDTSASGGACGSAEEQVVCFKLDLAASRLSVRYRLELRGKGKAGVGDVAVRPDRRLLVTAGWDGRVRLFKYRSGRPLAVLKYHSSPVASLRFAPRSMVLATAARDGTVALWPLYQPADPCDS